MRSNWAGNVIWRDTHTVFPRNESEVAAVLRAAPFVRVRGTGHSFNTIADTADLGLSLKNMPQAINIQKRPEGVTVTVGAHVRYGELALHIQAPISKKIGSLPHICIGGAISTGTHGSGAANGILATAVRSLDVVYPDGHLRHITRADGDLFDATVVGLGLCGIVLRVELAIEPTFDIAQSVFPGFPRALMWDHLEHVLGVAYSVSYFTTWAASGDGEVWAKFRCAREAPLTSLHGVAAASEKRHVLPGLDPEPCTEQMGEPGPWYTRLPHFKLAFNPSAGEELQSEYFVDAADAVSALRALEALAPQIHELLLVTEIRAVARDELWLSPAFERDSVAIHFTWKQEAKAVAELLTKIEAVLTPYRARPHWGKASVYTSPL